MNKYTFQIVYIYITLGLPKNLEFLTKITKKPEFLTILTS